MPNSKNQSQNQKTDKNQTSQSSQKQKVSNEDLLEIFKKYPEDFLVDALGVEQLESYQEKVLQTVATNERTAIAACHNLGKTFLAARVALWFGSCFPKSKIITTAPTYNQVKNILWSELRSAHKGSKVPLGGKVNLTEWKISDDWFALGFTPKDEISGEAGQGTQSSFQGFHAEGGVLVIFDEATGIPANVWTMAEGLLTSGNVKFIAIGNPTSKNSDFFKCFQSRDWAKVYLSCFDSPNFAANRILNKEDLRREVDLIRSMPDQEAREKLQSYISLKPYMLTVSWCIRSILKWGFDHPLTKSKIFGEFPEDADNSLINLGHVELAQAREYEPKEKDKKILGIDVARFGSDSTVMTALHGYKFEFRKAYNKKDIADLTGITIAEIKEHGFQVVVIDETGLGGGLVDNLKAAQKENVISKTIEIRGVQFGASPTKTELHTEEDAKEKYVNMKAQIFSLLADDLKDKLCLSDDSVYLEELPMILYKFDTKGRTYIESKDDFKKRTGLSSPDSADSLALANFGRYETVRVEAFTKQYSDDRAPTLAGSLNRGDEW